MFKISATHLTARTRTVQNIQKLAAWPIHIQGVATSTKTTGRAPRYTPTEDEQILTLLKAGHTWDYIGTAIKRGYNSVYCRYVKYLRYTDQGSFPSRRTYQKNPSIVARDLAILRLVENEGLSFTETARRLDLSLESVCGGYRRVCSPEKRTQGDRFSTYSEAEIETIASGLRQKKSYLEIAKELGPLRSSNGVALAIRRSKYLTGLRQAARRRYTPEDDDAIMAWAKSGRFCGLSVAHLAGQLDRSSRSIYHRLQFLKLRAESAAARSGSVSSVQRDRSSALNPSDISIQSAQEGVSSKKIPGPTSAPRKRGVNQWTPEADRLLEARPAGEKIDWDELATLFPGRTPQAVKCRYALLCGFSNGARRGYAPPDPAGSKAP